jgi:hypothetical protein
MVPFGIALLGRSRRHLRQWPARDGEGSTHIDTTFTGLTSSVSVTAQGKLPAGASHRPTISSECAMLHLFMIKGRTAVSHGHRAADRGRPAVATVW